MKGASRLTELSVSHWKDPWPSLFNQTETLVIKLNEKAQRADETVEDSHDVASTTHDSAKRESLSNSKPKKRKSDNQSVFPDRVVVKKEVKEEKVDYEYEKLVPLSYSSTTNQHETRADEREETPHAADHETPEGAHPQDDNLSVRWDDQTEGEDAETVPGDGGRSPPVESGGRYKPEAIVIDDEDDEQDDRCENSPYWASVASGS
nr:hypothetical protein BaRGS_029207 [Batillaria attramentaria]